MRKERVVENVAEGTVGCECTERGRVGKSVDLMGSFHVKGVGSDSVEGGKVMFRELEGAKSAVA